MRISGEQYPSTLETEVGDRNVVFDEEDKSNSKIFQSLLSRQNKTTRYSTIHPFFLEKYRFWDECCRA
jgi:hypothetical protein